MKNIFKLFIILYSSFSIASIDVKTYIPVNAKTYLPTLKKEQVLVWPDHSKPEILAGLIEQESCVSLTNSRCWSPTSKLSTSRELGIGLGQITKAYNSNGSVRFDALKEIRDLHFQELKELSWSNVIQRPDLQISAILLKLKDNYKNLYAISVDYERLAMTDSSYNAGMGRIYTDRRLCGLKKGCDSKIWFNNVELTCGASKKPIYGSTACGINRSHVSNVFKLRSDKYKPFFKDENKITVSSNDLPIISEVKQTTSLEPHTHDIISSVPVQIDKPSKVVVQKPIVQEQPIEQKEETSKPIVKKETLWSKVKSGISDLFSWI